MPRCRSAAARRWRVRFAPGCAGWVPAACRLSAAAAAPAAWAAAGGSGGPITREGATCAESTAPATSAARINRRSNERRIISPVWKLSCCWLGNFAGRPSRLIQFRFFLLPFPDAERSLPLEAHFVAVFRGLDAGAARGGRFRGFAFRGIFQARHPERRLAVDPLLALRRRCSGNRRRRPAPHPPESPIGLDASPPLALPGGSFGVVPSWPAGSAAESARAETKTTKNSFI